MQSKTTHVQKKPEQRKFYGIDEITYKNMTLLEHEIYENFNEYMEIALSKANELYPTADEKDRHKDLLDAYQRAYFLFKVKHFIENKREDDFLRISSINIKMYVKTGLSDYYSYKQKCSEPDIYNKFESIEKLIEINNNVHAIKKKRELEAMKV